jgi:hypothetical protein
MEKLTLFTAKSFRKITFALFGILLHSISAKAQVTTVGTEFTVNNYTDNKQTYAHTAMDGNGNFVVVWFGVGDVSNLSNIYARRYNSSGTPLGAEFKVNSLTSGSTQYAAITMNTAGNFVITWTDYNTDNGDIFARVYDAQGNASNAEFRVNTYTTNCQDFSKAAMDETGNFTITWESQGEDGSDEGVYAQRYDVTGNKAGSEFQVNTNTLYSQFSPDIAMNKTGNFVITWVGGQTGTQNIYAQLYDKNGNKTGGEFLVNTELTTLKNIPSAGMDDNGNFAISWAINGGPGIINYYIYAQRYNANGTTNGNGFVVNSCTDCNLNNSRMSMDGNGNFIITWNGYLTTDYNKYGSDIYGKIFNNDGSVFYSDFLINITRKWTQLEPYVAMNNNGNVVVAWASTTVIDSVSIPGLRIEYPDIETQLYSITRNNNTTGIINSNNIANITIVPNPFKDFINIILDEPSNTISSIYIKNIEGQIIYENNTRQNSPQLQLDLSNLTTGIYFLYIRTDKNEFMKKIIHN